MTETTKTDIVVRLWASDVASALTNEAAREIEALRALIRTMYEPACIYEGAGCDRLGEAHPEVLARAVGMQNV